MRKTFFVLLMALTFCATNNVIAQTKEKVAVCTLGEINPASRKIFDSKAVSRISSNKEFIALGRTDAFLRALTNEYNYPNTDDVIENLIAELGEKFKVDYVALFEATETPDGTCFVSARLIDSRRKLVIKSIDRSRNIKSVNDLSALANNIAIRLIKKDSK